MKEESKEEQTQVFFSIKDNLYPYMLVSIRSGCTFFKVESATSFKRISSTPLGASTFIGMAKLLYDVKDPTELLFDSAKGDLTNIDMTVGDIYGDAQTMEVLGLPPTLLASSFGKLKDMSQDQIQSLSRNDICRSLITMMLFNTLTIADIVARKEGLERVVIIG